MKQSEFGEYGRVKAIALVFLLGILTPFALGAEANGRKGSSAGGSSLPVLALEAKEKIGPVNRVPLQVRVTGGGTGDALSGSVRIHGASSQMYPKKSYSIALDKPVPWFGMKESAHWVLNAAFIDRSLMRHKLSSDLFQSMSRPGAPRFASASRFVEVNLNGRYQGVYLLMERVDRTLLGLKRYETNAANHACIYKAVDHAAFRWPGHSGFEQKEPDPLTKAFWKPLDELNAFVLSADDDEFFDPRKGIATRLDLENTIDFHLLVLLTSNMDGFDKNLILARDAPPAKGPAPRFFFVPWDYDASFGRTWHGSPFPPSAWLSNRLFDRLLSEPGYRKKFAARWTALRQREFALPTMERLIDENVQTLGPAAERNQAQWRGRAVQEDVAEMKQWLARHVKWLDLEIPRRTG